MLEKTQGSRDDIKLETPHHCCTHSHKKPTRGGGERESTAAIRGEGADKVEKTGPTAYPSRTRRPRQGAIMQIRIHDNMASTRQRDRIAIDSLSATSQHNAFVLNLAYRDRQSDKVSQLTHGSPSDDPNEWPQQSGDALDHI